MNYIKVFLKENNKYHFYGVLGDKQRNILQNTSNNRI